MARLHNREMVKSDGIAHLADARLTGQITADPVVTNFIRTARFGSRSI